MVRGRAELVLGLIVAAIGAYALSAALDLTMFSKTHVPGPGLFPTMITIGLLILGVLLAALSTRDIRRRRGAAARDLPASTIAGAPASSALTHDMTEAKAVIGEAMASADVTEPAETAEAMDEAEAIGSMHTAAEPGQGRRVVRAGAVLACYAIGIVLMSTLGFVPSAAILVFLVLFGVERRRNWKSLTAAVLIPVASFYLFVHLLALQLPTGVLNLGPLGS